MKKRILLLLIVLFSGLQSHAQDYGFRKNIDKDSLFKVVVKNLPEEMRKDYVNKYNEANQEVKDFFLFMLSMPDSSKKELIENYENKKDEILALKRKYEKFIPKNHIVYIEFEPASTIINVEESITLKIYKINNQKDKPNTNSVQRNNRYKVVSQNWKLKPDSKELEEILKTINWTSKTLGKIKTLLDRANCISIKNGSSTTIGFARSGMGKYSYKLFDQDLNKEQKENYTNGCEYIFYKNNVVLEYGGGAIGPQCFEKDQ